MKMLDNSPVTTSSGLVSSVPEVAPAAWTSGVNFAVDATTSVAVADGVDTGWTGLGQLDVYRSLQGPNSNHPPASSPTWWKKIGTVYQEFDNAKTYGVNDRVQIAADRLVYQSSASANVGNAPAASPAKWSLVGVTNRWAMFDEKVGTQTQAPDEIKVSWTVAGRANALAFLNLDAASIRYRQIAPDATVLIDETITLSSASGINSLFAYYTNPIIRKTDTAIEGMTFVAGCTIEVTVSNPGKAAKIGALVVGRFTKIGGTQYGAQLSFVDYSKYSEDSWGNLDLKPGAYRKRLVADVMMDGGYVDEFQRLMASRRGKFTVFWGADQYSSTLIYGFPKLGDTVIAYPNQSIASLTLEGLAQQ